MSGKGKKDTSSRKNNNKKRVPEVRREDGSSEAINTAVSTQSSSSVSEEGNPSSSSIVSSGTTLTTPIPEPMETPKSTATVGDDELDALLDEALLDFDKPLPESRKAKTKSSNSMFGGGGDVMNEAWTEEFIKEATMQFEKKMRECIQSGQGTSGAAAVNASSSPDQATASLHKVIDAATKAAVGDSDPGFIAQMNEAMKKIAAEPETFTNPMGFDDPDLTNLMNSFSLGDDVKDSEIEDILPYMTNMMQKLLSKELLYPVLSDIVDRYPDWLANNRSKISNTEFEKFNKQFDNMRLICEQYSKEEPNDSDETKQKRFDKISELMLKVQAAGPPPKDLVGDLDPLDTSGLPGVGNQCPVM